MTADQGKTPRTDHAFRGCDLTRISENRYPTETLRELHKEMLALELELSAALVRAEKAEMELAHVNSACDKYIDRLRKLDALEVGQRVEHNGAQHLLVPVEPTEEMFDALNGAPMYIEEIRRGEGYNRTETTVNYVNQRYSHDGWEAMIKAASEGLAP